MNFLTSRPFQFVVIPVSVMTWFALTDPSHGQDTLLRIQLFAQSLTITGLSYLVSKAMLGRISSQSLYEQVIKNASTPAAIAYFGVCVLRATTLLGFLTFFALIQR